MQNSIRRDFVDLSVRGKIAVLSRTIHMETIHNRDHAKDAERIYRASELIHRLSGFIMSLAYRPDDFQRDAAHAATLLIEGVMAHGDPYLVKLHGWILEAQTIS